MRLLSRYLFHPLFSLKDGNNYFRHIKKIKSELCEVQNDEEYQYRKIKEIIDYAYKHSKFYTRLYDEHGFNPDQFKTIKDLKNVPILKKKHISNSLSEILVPGYGTDDLIATATGGTTGNSFRFYYDRECHAKRHCLTLLVNERINWKVGDPTAIIWNAHQDLDGINGIKAKIRNSLSDRTWIFDALKINEQKLTHWTEILKKNKIEILYGYAHSVTEIVRYVSENNIDGLKIRLVVTTAEPLYKESRKLIENTLNCTVVDRYASREHGPMAQECRNGVMHYFGNSIYIETEKDHSDDKNSNDLLITDFWNKATPFIRYRIGDAGSGLKMECLCGSNLPVLEAFEGRDTDFLIATDGSLVSGMSLHEVYYNESDKKFGRSAIDRVQFIQKDKNTILVKTVPGKFFQKEYEEPFITNILKTILGREMCAKFQYVDEIPKSASGKYRFVINEM